MKSSQPTGPSVILAISDGSYCPSASSNNSYLAEDVSILVGQPPIGFHQLMNPLRASGRARTNHPFITSEVLYQMSYGGKIRKAT